MKDYLAGLVEEARTPAHGRNLAREYLQERILAGLQRAGAMIPLAFQGGTALRILYALPRYSEDLDFALERVPEQYRFRDYLAALTRDFQAEGYSPEVKLNDRRVVNTAFVRFRGLPYELGLSPHPDETLSVKLEVDTNPPKGAGLETTLVRRFLPLQLQHHDRASLLAGKLHAVLQRPHVKGRDLYDLLWYLSAPDWPEPNLTLLGNALRQTGWTGPEPSPSNWRSLVRDRVLSLDWAKVVSDVEPFLERPGDADLITRENLLHLLDSGLVPGSPPHCRTPGPVPYSRPTEEGRCESGP